MIDSLSASLSICNAEMAKIWKNHHRRMEAARARARQAQGASSGRLLRVHQRAIERLRLELLSGEGLMAWFQGAFQWQGAKYLVAPGQVVKVEVEATLRLDGRRYIPDLVVRCPASDRLLFAVEVWETHAVSPRKRAAYGTAGVPWIEVRAYKVYARHRRFPLAVVDWGGMADVESPCQLDLFEGSARLNLSMPSSTRAKEQFALCSRHWQLPPPLAGSGAKRHGW